MKCENKVEMPYRHILYEIWSVPIMYRESNSLNNYAIEAGQVGDALTRCASALDLAGNTIQESAG